MQKPNHLNKHKVALLRSIMNDPNLSKIMKESMSAPIGSTKRVQAKSVLSILQKMKNVPDGMGGVGSGTAGFDPVVTVKPHTATNYSNMVIFPASPQLKMANKKKVNTQTQSSQDGQGGPDYGGLFTPPTLTDGAAQSKASSLMNSGNDVMSSISNYFNFTPKPISTPALKPIPSYSAPSTGLGDVNKVDPNFFTNSWNSLGSSLANPKNPNYFGTPTTTKAPTLQTIKKPDNYLTKSTTESQPQLLNNISQYFPDLSKTTQFPTIPQNTQQSNTNQSDPNAFVYPPQKGSGSLSFNSSANSSTYGGSSDPGAYTNNSSLANAVRNNTGPATFALNAMGDPDLLRKLGVPEGMIPQSGSLATTISGIQTALKQEYGIDSLLNQLTNTKNQGPTFINNIQDYIRGKDEYVGYVDSLIDKTKDSMANRGIVSAEDQTIHNNALQYLYTMKGRQNGRYIDFLNRSVNEYNGNVQALQTQYDNTMAQYTDAVKTDATIAQDDYNKLYTSLSDMYTTLENAPQKALQTQYLQQQLYNAQLQAVIDASGGNQSTKWVKEQADYDQMLFDEKHKLRPDADISSTVLNLKEQNYDPLGVVNLFERGMTDSLNSETDPTAGITLAGKYKDNVLKFASDFKGVPGASNAAYALGNTIFTKSSDILSKYILQKGDEVKSAVEDLIPSKSFWGGARSTPAKDKFVSDHSGSLDKQILGDIYDYYSLAVKSAPNVDPNYWFVDKEGTKVKNATSDEIAKSLSSGISQIWKSQLATLTSS